MEDKVPQAVIIIFGLSIILLIISSVKLFNIYNMLNDDVITHLDFSGSPDKKGGKIHLIYGLLVNLGVLILMYFLIKHPKYANYPVEINDENRSSAYLKMRYLVSILSLITSTSFLWMILIQEVKKV
ncbi:MULTISPECIES: hypothetical protein [Sphingobacterium]|uniref:hypothetical protein n=1 Tax=Sphingobacterium TaxID=28453 RepID=UPI0013DCE68C|nr:MULTISPECIES: hypothetical protein [unclassified Sphingobacterium]